MTFEDFLLEKNIPFTKVGDNILVEDKDLLDHLSEISERFPMVEIELVLEDDIEELPEDVKSELERQFKKDRFNEMTKEQWDEYWSDEDINEGTLEKDMD